MSVSGEADAAETDAVASEIVTASDWQPRDMVWFSVVHTGNFRSNEILLLFDLVRNQSNYSKFLNIYLNVICTICVSKKMWLSTELLTIALQWSWLLTLLEVFILGHYDPPSTGRIQQLVCNTNHQQGATKLLKLLNKYLLMVTFDILYIIIII